MALVLGLALAAPAQSPPTTSGESGMALLNLDNTVALHGYDPVAYFTDNLMPFSVFGFRNHKYAASTSYR